jgi:hypothetical protein
MTQTTNPLRAWFRQPAIYIRLPSQGQYWPEGSINFPENRELPVMPMTALDEINYRTPDALFNGQAVVDVIQSCLPNILDAWQTPAVDINSVLISIRIASYGHEMEISSTCPKCSEANDYGLDMRVMLDNLALPNYGDTLRTGDIETFFRPMTFRQQTQVSMDQYDTQRMIQSAQDEKLPESDRVNMMSGVMKRINEATTRALTYGIAGIRSPGGFADSAEHVQEFLSNCDSKTYQQIRDHAVKLRGDSDVRPVHLTCADCQHQYDQVIELNMSSFFGAAS